MTAPAMTWVSLDELEEMADNSGAGVQQLDDRTFLALVDGRIYVAEEPRPCRHAAYDNGRCVLCSADEPTGGAA